MQENSKSEKPQDSDSLEKEEAPADAVEETPEDSKSDPGFEEDAVKTPEDSKSDPGFEEDAVKTPEDSESDPRFEEDAVKTPEDSESDPGFEEDAVKTPEDSESDLGFEEQEFLPAEEKKKSGAGKVIFLMVLVLAGSGGYLYFNNLLPAEILNFVFPKSDTSKPLALVTPTPPFMDEAAAKISEPAEAPELVTPTPPFMDEAVAKIPEPADVPDAEIAKLATVSPPEIQETRISDTPSTSPAHLSGNDFDQTLEKEDVAEELQKTASLEEPDPTIEQKVTEEVVTEVIISPEPSLSEPDELQRTEAVQAYLEFIESSVQKLGQLIKEGFNWGSDYLKQKLS